MQCQMWAQLSQGLVQTFRAGAKLLQCLSIDTNGPQNLRKAHEFYSQSFHDRDWGHRENGWYQTHSPQSVVVERQQERVVSTQMQDMESTQSSGDTKWVARRMGVRT